MKEKFYVERAANYSIDGVSSDVLVWRVASTKLDSYEDAENYIKANQDFEHMYRIQKVFV